METCSTCLHSQCFCVYVNKYPVYNRICLSLCAFLCRFLVWQTKTFLRTHRDPSQKCKCVELCSTTVSGGLGLVICAICGKYENYQWIALGFTLCVSTSTYLKVGFTFVPAIHFNLETPIFKEFLWFTPSTNDFPNSTPSLPAKFGAKTEAVSHEHNSQIFALPEKLRVLLNRQLASQKVEKGHCQ